MISYLIILYYFYCLLMLPAYEKNFYFAISTAARWLPTKVLLLRSRAFPYLQKL